MAILANTTGEAGLYEAQNSQKLDQKFDSVPDQNGSRFRVKKRCLMRCAASLGARRIKNTQLGKGGCSVRLQTDPFVAKFWGKASNGRFWPMSLPSARPAGN